IQAAWKENEIPCAAIINGLAGWRLDLNEARSHTREIDPLEFSLHLSRIRRETLDAMMDAVRSEIETPRQALRLIARGLGKKQIDPWDLLAPAPARGQRSQRRFSEGLSLV